MGARFVGATLTKIDFHNADLTAVVFKYVTLEETDFQDGVLCNTQMPNELMDNSDC